MSDRKKVIIAVNTPKGAVSQKPLAATIANPIVLDVNYRRDGVNHINRPPDSARFQFIGDSFRRSDSARIATSKGFSETIGVVEGVVFLGLQMLKVSAVSISETWSVDFAKVTAEEVRVSESVQVALSTFREFLESLTSHDALASSELTSLLSSWDRLDSVAKSDTLSKAVMLARQEAVNKSDTGFVLCQNYTGVDYFENDYVGTKQTF